MSHALHKRWLYVSSTLTGLSAPVFFFGSMERTSELASFILSMQSGGHDMPFGDPTTRFLSAITASYMLGWAVTIWMLIDVYDHAPEPTRRAVLVGMLSSFTLDCTGSIASGHPKNCITNLFFMLLAIGPLWRPVRVTDGEVALLVPK